jgi:hypothetical protein
MSLSPHEEKLNMVPLPENPMQAKIAEFHFF